MRESLMRPETETGLRRLKEYGLNGKRIRKRRDALTGYTRRK